MDRINDDYEHGYIRFPGRESREPGHVFLADGEKASDLVSLLGIDYDMGLSRGVRASTERCGRSR